MSRTLLVLIITTPLIVLSSALFFTLYKQTPAEKIRLYFLLQPELEQAFIEGTPYRENIEHALETFSHTDITPVIGTGIGRSEQLFLETTGARGVADEIVTNRDLVSAVISRNIPLWFHIRVSTVHLPTSPERTAYFTPTVDDLEKNPEIKSQFITAFTDRLRTFTLQVPRNECTVILFDDENPYMSIASGGRFWVGASFDPDEPVEDMDGYKPLVSTKKDETTDKLFSSRFSSLYSELHDLIKTERPDCAVGIFLSATQMARTYDGKSSLEHIVHMIPSEKRPDIVVFRLFSKSYTTHTAFEHALTQTTDLLSSVLPPETKRIFIAQLHTTNRQGEGAGRLPSLAQLEQTLSISKTLPLDGLGYLGADIHESSPIGDVDIAGKMTPACLMHHNNGVFMRNVACSHEEDSEPFAPNIRGWRLLIDPRNEPFGTQRFEKGIELLQKY